jgi:hypothetical protein
MNAFRHGLASVLEGAQPDVMLDIDSLALRLAKIEAERAKLIQQLEHQFAAQDVPAIERTLKRAAALNRYAERSASQLRKR